MASRCCPKFAPLATLALLVATAPVPSAASDDSFLAAVAPEFVEEFSSMDESSLLQKAPLSPEVYAANNVSKMAEPFLVALRRESVPIYRRGKVASFKTSYSGVLSLGTPAQEFRVVFDTGSGHLVLPAAECESEACLVPGRQKFNMSASTTAKAINSDGSPVPDGEECDQVTIGFGTGEITGEFTKDIVCFDSAAAAAKKFGDSDAVALAGESLLATSSNSSQTELCVEMSVILAVEMSSQPFKTFRFDGILGLGLDGLALSPEFSFFEMLLGKNLPHAQFGIFLTEGEHGEESEVSFGGADERRTLEPLSWANVVMPEHGHWQVRIKAVRIDGHELDVCKDGTCRGVVDTGTSHLGVPAPADKEMADLLTADAEDLLDCRYANTPDIEIELEDGYVLNLMPWNYMRRLPLRDGVSVSSANGVTLNGTEANGTANGTAKAPEPQKDPAGDAAAAATADATTEAAAPEATETEAAATETAAAAATETAATEAAAGTEAQFESEAEPATANAPPPSTSEASVPGPQGSLEASQPSTLEVISLMQGDLLADRPEGQAAEGAAAAADKEASSSSASASEAAPSSSESDSESESKSERERDGSSKEGSEAEASQAEAPQQQQQDEEQQKEPRGEAANAAPQAEGAAASSSSSSSSSPAAAAAAPEEEEEGPVKRFCRPRLMPVRLPAPLGPKLFILGEPVLHRYYTVYDWANHRVGFSLARNKRNTMDPAELAGMKGQLPQEVDMLLMQQRLTMKREAKPQSEPGRPALPGAVGDGREVALPSADNLEGDDYEEETVLMQVKLRMTLRERKAASSAAASP